MLKFKLEDSYEFCTSLKVSVHASMDSSAIQGRHRWLGENNFTGKLLVEVSTMLD